VLPYSIGSLLRQSFTDFELLVVGDGCTDDSEQVVTAIADLNCVRRLVEKTTGAMPYLSFLTPAAGSGSNERK
jgi:glycosyltransferase involved in cell wall biosynthesis